ncbi:MAG: PHP domain-containing protein [Candidatus Rokuibacteriota bacterium]
MPWLRGNLHAHTTFSDGVKEPAQLVAAYEALGYDFLAITDHESWIDDSYWSAIPRVSSKLLLFHGIELNWPRFDQHIGRVPGDRETLHVLNHPARYRLSVTQTLERIRRIGAGGITLDAIEVTETGQRHPIYESAEIPLVKIATDDAHGPIHFGRAWVEVDARRDRDAIIRAIRAGEFRLGFARD